MTPLEIQAIVNAEPETLGAKALRLYKEVKKCENRLKDLKVDRDLAVEEAYEHGVTDYEGFRFIKAKPPMTVTSDSIAEYDLAHDTDFLGDYIGWYRAHCEVKVSTELFKKYLETTINELPEGVDSETLLKAVQVPSGTDRCPYSVREVKE